MVRVREDAKKTVVGPQMWECRICWRREVGGGVFVYGVCGVDGVCCVYMCIWHDKCTLVYVGCGGGVVFVCDVYVCECEHGMVCVYAVWYVRCV